MKTDGKYFFAPDCAGAEEGDYIFYKEQRTDQFFNVDHVGYLGELLFSPDGEKIYNLFRDYPKKFTDEEKEIFDRENPFWADFFKDRS